MQWDETTGVGGTNTWSTVTNWFVSNRKFSQVFTNHFWLDWYDVKMFSVVYSCYTTNHVWHDDHITQVRFYWRWDFVWSNCCGCPLGRTQLSHKAVVLWWHTAFEPSSCTRS